MGADEIDSLRWFNWGFPRVSSDSADDTNTTTGTGCRKCLENYQFHWFCTDGYELTEDGEYHTDKWSKARILEWHVAHDNDALDALVKGTEPPHPLGRFEPLLLERWKMEEHHSHVHVPLSAMEEALDSGAGGDEFKRYVAFLKQGNLPPFA